MLYLKIEFMNWADFFNADSDAIIFGYPTLWHLDAGGPRQLYFLFGS